MHKLRVEIAETRTLSRPRPRWKVWSNGCLTLARYTYILDWTVLTVTTVSTFCIRFFMLDSDCLFPRFCQSLSLYFFLFSPFCLLYIILSCIFYPLVLILLESTLSFLGIYLFLSLAPSTAVSSQPLTKVKTRNMLKSETLVIPPRRLPWAKFYVLLTAHPCIIL